MTQTKPILNEDGYYDYGICRVCGSRIVREKRKAGFVPVTCGNPDCFFKERANYQHQYWLDKVTARAKLQEQKQAEVKKIEEKAKKYDELAARWKKIKEARGENG